MAKANTSATPITPVARKVLEVSDLFETAYDQCKTAAALLDAAEVLSALERAPEHHDTHPSHNIRTGGGYAHGRRLQNDTLPTLLAHARYLVKSSMNDFDVMRETAIEEINKKVAA